MKKQMIVLLNNSFASNLVAKLTEKFPDIKNVVTSFSIAEGRVVCDYDSQGKVKNREIDSFIDTFRLGYVCAMEVITKMA